MALAIRFRTEAEFDSAVVAEFDLGPFPIGATGGFQEAGNTHAAQAPGTGRRTPAFKAGPVGQADGVFDIALEITRVDFDPEGRAVREAVDSVQQA